MIDKYGVENPSQLNLVKEKKKQTSLRNYGVENPNQSILIKEKKKQTCLDKYGVENPSQNIEVRKKTKQTCLDKYGVDYSTQSEIMKEKSKQTIMKRYSVEHPLKSITIKNKLKQTCLDKYGVENPNQNIEVRKKTKHTCLDKYGVDNPLKSSLVRDKCKLTCFKKYGVDSVLKSAKIRNKIYCTRRISFYNKLLNSNRLQGLIKPLFSLKDYTGTKDSYYEFQCVKCNSVFEDHLKDGKVPRCFNCYPILKTYVSKYEDDIESWLSNLGITNIQRGNQSIINPYQLDIYLPDFKLAIEFNGLYWHSELSGNKDKSYHLNKTSLCKEKGIELIHIFEDEWIEKQDIVKSIIKNKLGLTANRIYARECIIKEVDKEEALLFLMNNHLQEATIIKYNYGLYYKDDLVHLISLSKPRFNKNYEYELIRSCSKINTSIAGGFNKLVNYAVNTLNISSIISYADKRYFNGKGYKDWKLVNETKPNYFYTKGYINRESRIKYQKHKLENLFPDVYDKVLTEWQIMQLKSYDRIWDCGNKVFVWSV